MRSLKFFWVFVTFVVVPFTLSDDNTTSMLKRINRASNLWVYDSLIELHDEILEGVELEGAPQSRVLLGIIDYWMSGYYWQKERDSARFYLKELIEKIEEVPENKRTAEEWAFLGYSYGTLIPLKGFLSAPGLGEKSGKAYKRAFKLNAKSPLVNLLRGISLLHTPKTFGGGADKALKVLDDALELYKTNQGPIPWGENVAMLHKAMALKKLGRKEEAIGVLKETLQKYPEFGWAKATLEAWEGGK